MTESDERPSDTSPLNEDTPNPAATLAERPTISDTAHLPADAEHAHPRGTIQPLLSDQAATEPPTEQSRVPRPQRVSRLRALPNPVPPHSYETVDTHDEPDDDNDSDDIEPDRIWPAERYTVGYPEDDPWQAGLVVDAVIDNSLMRIVVPLNPGNISTIMRGLRSVADAQGADLTATVDDDSDDEPGRRKTLTERADPLGIRQIIDNPFGRWVLVGVVVVILILFVLNKVFS